MEEKEYAARSTPALQKIISLREECTWHVRDMMQRSVLTSLNILLWSF